MRLSFDYDYEDYDDEANFLPALNRMQQLFENMPDSITEQPEAILLDTMESLIELMRYYAVKQDMASLEKVMRKFQPLLQTCKDKQSDSAGFYYLELEFERINALLYANVAQYAQADQHYKNGLTAAGKCFAACQKDASVNDKQKAFLGFSLIEMHMEASNNADRMMDAHRAYTVLASGKRTADWLKDYVDDYPGVQDKLSVFYGDLAGQACAQGDIALGQDCFEIAKILLGDLYVNHGDFYGARRCWVVASQASAELVSMGNAGLLSGAETEIAGFLSNSELNDRDRAIAQFAMGSILTAKSSLLQGAQRFQDAVVVSQESVELYEMAYPVFKRAYEDASSTEQVVMSPIMLRGFSSYVGALEVMGIQLFACEAYDQAMDTFLKALHIMGDENDLKMGESMANLLQAEMYYYMSLIESERDAGKCEYYASQSADMAVEILRGGNVLTVATMAVNSCALTAEICLMLKNKPKALQYAEKGINVLNQFEDGIEEAGNIRSVLEKLRKKASRRFF